MTYMEGVTQFLEKAKFHVNNLGKTRCPCKNCMNTVWKSLDGVERHLLTYGMSPLYSQWVYHGETSNLSRELNQTTHSIRGEELNPEEFTDVPTEENEMLNILNDLQVRSFEEELHEEDIETEVPINVHESDNSKLFEDLLGQACNQLYAGCTKYSSLNFLVRLMHIKVLNGWSNKSFDMLLELLKSAFSTDASIPSSYYEAKKKLRDLGLGYDLIHACKYDCILY